MRVSIALPSAAAIFSPIDRRGSNSRETFSTSTSALTYSPPPSALTHSNDKEKRFGAFNFLGYHNAEMDKLIQDAAVEMDEGKRRGFLERANELVLKDRQRLPIAPYRRPRPGVRLMPLGPESRPVSA